MCAARSGKVRQDVIDNSHEVGFLPRKFGLVPVQHRRCLIAFQLKAAIRGCSPQTVDGGSTPSSARVFKNFEVVLQTTGQC